MKRELKVYDIVLSEDLENSGVNYVALVDKPAIKTNWFAFDEKMKFSAEKDRQLVTMPLMIADLPIYRRDNERGEYYVRFTAQQIEMIQQKFMKNGFLHNVNEMHDSNKKVEGVYLVNSFVSDKQMGIEAPEMFKDLPYGSWFGTYKFTDTAYFNEVVKSGEFQGVSVEGVFDLVDEKTMLENKIKKQIDEILQ